MQGLLGLPPGLAGFVAQRQLAGRDQDRALNQAQGLLSMESMKAQQGMLAQRQAEQQKQQAQVEAFAQTLPPEQQQAFRIDPQGFMKNRTQQYTLTPGAVRYGPDGKPIASAPVAPKAPVVSSLTRLIQERDALPQGDPNRALLDQAIAKQTTHAPAPSATIINRQETEEAKAIGHDLGKQYTALQNGSLSAGVKISKLQRMAQLSEGITTGKLAPAMTEVAAIADAFGIKVDKNLGPKQAFEALSNEISLSNRSTADGGGMPGAMSDKDREFLKAMSPSLSKTPEGNKIIIETGIKLAKRQQDVAKMAREYRQKHKTLEGFAQELQKWADENPLFEGVGGLSVGTVKDGYKFKGGNPADKNNWEKQ